MCVGLKRNELKGGITARGSGDEKWFTGALYILEVEDIFWKCSPSFRKPITTYSRPPSLGGKNAKGTRSRKWYDSLNPTVVHVNSNHNALLVHTRKARKSTLPYSNAQNLASGRQPATLIANSSFDLNSAAKYAISPRMPFSLIIFSILS